jgi:hypothetical protein
LLTENEFKREAEASAAMKSSLLLKHGADIQSKRSIISNIKEEPSLVASEKKTKQGTYLGSHVALQSTSDESGKVNDPACTKSQIVQIQMENALN